MSTKQNARIPIDAWLRDLADAYDDVGLEIVTVISMLDEEGVEEFLEEHPLPGTVGVDILPEGTFGVGLTFEDFFIVRFNLPRLLLFDMDGTVLWEGDPGFKIDVTPLPPYPSFLDDPLDDLVMKRKLRELLRWRPAWEGEGGGREALHRGDLAAAVPLLQTALQFDPKYAPEAGRAASRLRALLAAMEDLEGVGDVLADRGVDPVLQVLLDWAPLVEIEVDRKVKAGLKSVLGSKTSKHWTRALRACENLTKGRGTPEENAARLSAELAELGGHLVTTLADDLTRAREAQDYEAFAAIAAGATQRPGIWLAREYFGW